MGSLKRSHLKSFHAATAIALFLAPEIANVARAHFHRGPLVLANGVADSVGIIGGQPCRQMKQGQQSRLGSNCVSRGPSCFGPSLIPCFGDCKTCDVVVGDALINDQNGFDYRVFEANCDGTQLGQCTRESTFLLDACKCIAGINEMPSLTSCGSFDAAKRSNCSGGY